MARRISVAALKRLPQTDAVWHVAVRPLRTWVAEPGEAPVQPWVTIVVEYERGPVGLAVRPERPAARELAEFLFQTMREPNPALQTKPGRPAEIHLGDGAMVAEIDTQMAKIGVAVEQQDDPPFVDELVNGLEEQIGTSQEESSLLAAPGVTPEIVGSFFEAATAYYRAEVWYALTDEQPLAVRIPPRGKKKYVSIMGGAGIEIGLGVYDRWKDLTRIYTESLSSERLIPKDGLQMMNFGDMTEVPFPDLEAIETHGWEIADEQAYPIPIRVMPGAEEVQRPNRDELLWYEALLRALPVFVQDHLTELPDGDFAPVDATIAVATAAGDMQVRIAYPAGKMPARGERKRKQASGVELPFDRRALEGQLSQLSPGFDDPALQQAQQTMYQAWGESRPKRRIQLAREALALSADCADAYVLLAEEEAKTAEESLSLYEQGTTAGARGLGREMFDRHAGDFWGILETRPYMRARTGLAQVLNYVGRKEEARDHYRELLRLNQQDNQGNRYGLLHLLLELGDVEGALRLIADYDEESTDWLYTKALLNFKRSGPTAKTNRTLRSALEENPIVPDFLTGQRRLPAEPWGLVSLGGEEEAANYAYHYLKYWRNTPGALDWLKAKT